MDVDQVKDTNVILLIIKFCNGSHLLVASRQYKFILHRMVLVDAS